MSKIFLVNGPPGTGKTTWLSRQARAAADKHTPSDVAIASLTRTAAAEVAGRDHGIPDANVGTLHAHCYRALDRPDLAETPEGIRSFNEAHPHYRLTGGGEQLDDATIDPDGGQTKGDEIHASVMNHRARMSDPSLWTPQQHDYHQTWTDFKTQTGRLDFTDLIEQCISEQIGHPAMPRALFLDEAQDFSRLELALAQQWSTQTETTVIVGDPHQALYSWRGSDPHALDTLHVAGRRTLEQSYRVPVAVHAVAARWLHATTGATIAYRPTPQAGAVATHHATLRHPEQLLASIEHDLSEGDSVMLLASCRHMLAVLVTVLRERGVPFHNPYRVKAGDWNPLRGAGRLLAFLRPSYAAWGDGARPWTWNDLRQWAEPLAARDALARGAKTLIENKCRQGTFGETQADDPVELDTVAALLGTTTLEHPALRGDVDWWAGNLRAKEAKRLAYPLEVMRRRGPAALHTRPRLIIGTIHSVKGGEADNVYVFPDLSRRGMHSWHLRGEGRDQIARMFYVALTRARTRVTLCEAAGPERAPLHELAIQQEAAA